MSESKARMQADLRALRREADRAHAIAADLLQHIVDLHEHLHQVHGERHQLAVQVPESLWRRVNV